MAKTMKIPEETMAKNVKIETKQVGQSFGVCGVVRDAQNGRQLAETRVRPHGCDSVALGDARALCENNGWTIIEKGASE